VTLGRTGLRVSVAGLGCGGFSQLGLAQGKSEDDAIAIIRQSLDLGVNLFDTAAAYRTEAVLGKAIKSVRREDVVITTKAPFSFSNSHSTAEGLVASLDKSLLSTDVRNCEPAWNKDPVFGVIGIQSGPPGRGVHSGFRGGCGSQVGDAGSGNRPALIEADQVERVLADIDADSGDVDGIASRDMGRAPSSC
jgi:hypothetical protein